MSLDRSLPSPLTLSLALAFGSTLASPVQAGLGPLRQLSVPGQPWLAEVETGVLPDSATPDVRIVPASDYGGLTAATPNARQLTIRAERNPSGAWRVVLSGPPLAAGDPLHFALSLSGERVRWVREYRIHSYLPPVAMPDPAMAARPASYRVVTGDTLSAITRRFYPQQERRALAVLLAANPHAFVQDDPNRLRAGVSLRLPPRLRTPLVAAGAPKVSAPPAAPRPAKVVAPPALTAPDATPRQLAQQQVERLQQAQARLLQLEHEVQRQLALAPAAPQIRPAEADDAALDEVLAWYLAGGGGLAVMSLLAWRLARRRTLVPASPAPLPAMAVAVDAGIVTQPYLADDTPMLRIDHAQTPPPPVASADTALADLFTQIGEPAAAAELDAWRDAR